MMRVKVAYIGTVINATLCGSGGIMSTARLGLHYLLGISRPTYRSGKLCDGSSHVHNTLVILDVRVAALCKLETLLFMMRVKVAYIRNKPPLVVEPE